jgi:hypothetical protein
MTRELGDSRTGPNSGDLNGLRVAPSSNQSRIMNLIVQHRISDAASDEYSHDVGKHSTVMTKVLNTHSTASRVQDSDKYNSTVMSPVQR